MKETSRLDSLAFRVLKPHTSARTELEREREVVRNSSPHVWFGTKENREEGRKGEKGGGGRQSHRCIVAPDLRNFSSLAAQLQMQMTE